MIKTIYNFFWATVYYINGCCKSVHRIFDKNQDNKVKLKKIIGSGASVCSFIYQSFLLLSLCSLFGVVVIDLVIDMTDTQHIVLNGLITIALVVLFVIVAIVLNVFFELFYYIMSKGESYARVFKAQKSGNKFMLTFISLFSLYCAVKQTNTIANNLLLFVCSIDVLLCILATNIYEIFILPHHVIKKIYEEWYLHYTFRKKY